MRRSGALGAVVQIAAAGIGAGAAGAPYPPSPVITAIRWAPASTVERHAAGSDNWPVTWGEDGRIYTAFGDGLGFRTTPSLPRLSLGFARLTGFPGALRGRNVRSPLGERMGDGRTGEKASGLLDVEGELFMWVRNADRDGRGCRLAWSADRARTWRWAAWTFAELGYCAFVNFGRGYAGARDGYVYMVSPDTDHGYVEADGVVLTRVPRDRVADKAAYEFFGGLDAGGRPRWSSRFEDRRPAFVFPGGSNRLDVVYDAPLRRYLMTMRSRALGGGIDHFGIYDAPEPWGPWTTVYYTEHAAEWGESQHIPSKWIGADGRTIYVVFSGGDSLSIRRADLTVDAAALARAKAGGRPAASPPRPQPAGLVWPTEGWETAEPAELGMDRAALEAARDYALNGGGSGMIARHGVLAMSWGRLGRVYDLKSTTKSIAGTALGLAIGDRLVDVDTPARRYLAGIGLPPASNAETGWTDDITLLQLATHTAGFDKGGGFERLLFAPGTGWAYSDGGANWLADVLTMTFRRDLLDVLTERVFSPLGLDSSDLRWRENGYRPKAIDGIARREMGSGIYANVDAMARIGQLYLRDGVWDGRRILPRSFVDMVARPAPSVDRLPVFDGGRALAGASARYGVLWWTNANGAMANVPRDAFWAWGLHDSLIVVIPSLDIAASRAGRGWSCCWGSVADIEPFIERIARAVSGTGVGK